MWKSTIKTVLVSSLFVGGCYVDDPPPPQYAAAPGAVAEDPNDLVEVSPGVEVIADYDEPIFFADDYYWANRGGIWYRSTWYGGGWGPAGGEVPIGIRGIGHPEMYAHYRPAGWAPRGRVGVVGEQRYGGNRGGVVGERRYGGGGGASFRARPAVRGGGGHRR